MLRDGPTGVRRAGRFLALLDGDLFLPGEWSADRGRCRDAGIPDGVVHRHKCRIALEMLDRARGNWVVLSGLTFDEGYGRVTEFLHALDDRGQQYVAEVPTTFTGWCVRPRLLHREHHPADRLGRPLSFPRLAASVRPASAVRDLLRCSSALAGQPWERFHMKDTTKGPAVWEAKMVPLFLRRDDLPVLRLQRPGRDAGGGGAARRPQPLAGRAVLPGRGDGAGAGPLQSRTYDAPVRHLTITAATFLFLSKVRFGRRERTTPE